jgi:hypothetical protein
VWESLQFDCDWEEWKFGVAVLFHGRFWFWLFWDKGQRRHARIWMGEHLGAFFF